MLSASVRKDNGLEPASLWGLFSGCYAWKTSMKIENGMSKVPAVTLSFWIIKIIATTLGETGGDAFSMTLNWGYALSSTMFIGIFAGAVAAQIAARRFHPF